MLWFPPLHVRMPAEVFFSYLSNVVLMFGNCLTFNPDILPVLMKNVHGAGGWEFVFVQIEGLWGDCVELAFKPHWRQVAVAPQKGISLVGQ